MKLDDKTMIRKIFYITVPSVVTATTLLSIYFGYSRYKYSPWVSIGPHSREAASAAILISIIIIVVLYIARLYINKRNKSSEKPAYLHALAWSIVSTGISTLTCAGLFVSLHYHNRYILMGGSFLSYYCILPIFVWFYLIYYLADLIEIRINDNLIGAYEAWVIFAFSTPFFAMFYDVFRHEILGWHLIPDSGESLRIATIKAYFFIFLGAIVKSVTFTPFLVITIPFFKKFKDVEMQ